MASKKTLNASNLEVLGAARLAELLMEISGGNAAAKRRLRLELAGKESPAELISEIRKRLATIARSRSFVDWQNRKSLVYDLETQRRAIVDQVAKRLPDEGLGLIGRCDDSSGVAPQLPISVTSPAQPNHLTRNSSGRRCSIHCFTTITANLTV